MLIRAIILAPLLLAWFGCTAKPTDIVGTWIMASQSRQRMPEMQSAAATITLRADGTFVASEIPKEVIFEGTQPISGSGVWKLTSRDGQQRVYLGFEMVDSVARSAGTHLILGGIYDLSLFYSQGDPDEGKRIYFEKKK